MDPDKLLPSPEETALKLEEQQLKVQELKLKVKDLETHPLKKFATWTSLTAILIALGGVIGQNILSSIKAENSKIELKEAQIKRDSAKVAEITAKKYVTASTAVVNKAKQELVTTELALKSKQQDISTLEGRLKELNTILSSIPQTRANTIQLNRAKSIVKNTKSDLTTRTEISSAIATQVLKNDVPKLLGPVITQLQPASSPNSANISVPSSHPTDDSGTEGSESNGRRLTATLLETKRIRRTYYYSIRLTVTSTDPKKPLLEAVKFYLHSSFRNPVVAIQPEDNTASMRISAYGSFKVRAVTDDGATALEFDLANIVGAPQEFKDR